MLIYYNHAKSRTKARVTTIHHQPEKLTPERRAQGITVDTLPERPAAQRGQSSALYCNPETGDVWYEMEDRALAPEEDMLARLEALEERVDRLEAGGESKPTV